MEMSRKYGIMVTLVLQKASKLMATYLRDRQSKKALVPMTFLVQVNWRYRKFENQTFTVYILSWNEVCTRQGYH